jgi:hypothetical protein
MHNAIRYVCVMVMMAVVTLMVKAHDFTFINHTDADIAVQAIVSAKPFTIPMRSDGKSNQESVSMCLDTNRVILTRNGETVETTVISVPVEIYNKIMGEVTSTGKTTVDLNRFSVRMRNRPVCADTSLDIIVDVEGIMRVIVQK